jgi:hypothetical protein
MEAKWAWVPFSDAKQWKMGMLVDWESGRIEQLSGATQGTGTLVELDAVYLEKGYNPKRNDILDKSKIIVYEIKTSANGQIDPGQLAKLSAVQGGEIRQIWSELKWQQSTNTLVPNKRYAKALSLHQMSLRAKVGLAATAGVFVVLTSGDQAMANVDQQIQTLQDFKVSGKTKQEIKEQEAMVLVALKNLIDGLTGGTSDELTGWMILDHVYKKLIPVWLTP